MIRCIEFEVIEAEMFEAPSRVVRLTLDLYCRRWRLLAAVTAGAGEVRSGGCAPTCSAVLVAEGFLIPRCVSAREGGVG